MKHLNFSQTVYRALFCILGLIVSNNLLSQNSNSAICEEGDCLTAIFNIKLEESLNPDAGFDQERTERFQKSYTEFQTVKASYINKDSWQAKYNASQIGGQSCLRHYQLESMFAHEYAINSDFKSWMDSNGYSGEDYLQFGFNNSRKGLNLKTRMKSICNSEINKIEEKAGPDLNNLPLEYRKLGQELGYFDEEGNLLKLIEIPEAEKLADAPKLSKSEQVEQLKRRVDALPLDGKTLDEINAAKQDLEALKSRADKLQDDLKTHSSSAATSLEPQNSSADKLAKTKNKLGELLNWEPKSPQVALMDRIEALVNRTEKAEKKADDLANQPQDLKANLEDLNNQVQQISMEIDTRIKDLSGIKDKMSNLRTIRNEIANKLNDKPKKILTELHNSVEDIEERVNDLVKKETYTTDAKNELLQKLTDLEKRKEELLAQKSNFEKDVKDLEKESNDIEQATNAVVQKVEQTKKEEQKAADQKAAALEKERQALEEKQQALEEEANEEAKIKEEFGQEIDLEPVSTEEWTENFEVKREYWDAVFHPDDEVVEGFKGRWFQVNLKDAAKNVKLLFGPGEYFMDKADFRDNYGSVISAFVMEALNGMKKSERNAVKLFIQGSADITGQNTFRGKLDENFMYEKVTVLPQKGSTDNFESSPADKNISATSFTNDDLPNLRGHYLKEMVSVYSKKLAPVLLEGSVKKKQDTADRNAVIYLFIPESLVEKYEE